MHVSLYKAGTGSYQTRGASYVTGAGCVCEAL